MKKPIFTALSPNAEPDDVWLAFKTLFQPWNWQKGKASEELKQQFAEWLPLTREVCREVFGSPTDGLINSREARLSQYVFPFESGRTSLYAILLALDVKKDDEVLFQSYTCVAVPEPVLWIGAKPIYVDCDENLQMSSLDLEKKITPRSKVLIVQHTFGFPADLATVMAIAHRYNLIVIEDCAHAMGATYQEKKVGTFGVAGFFSFGRDKVISSVFGGLVTTNDQKMAEKLKSFYDSCAYPSKWWIFQQLLHPMLLALVKATYGIFLGRILLRIFKSLGLLSKAVYNEERKGEKPPFIFKKMPNGLAILAIHQFKKLDRFNQHRTQLAKKYSEALKDLPVVLPQIQPYTEPVVLRYTLRVKNPGLLLKAASRESIYLGDWYTTGIAPEGVHYEKIHYNPSDCPMAERLAQETINLPTNIGIHENDAQRIIEFLKKFYGV